MNMRDYPTLVIIHVDTNSCKEKVLLLLFLISQLLKGIEL